MVADMTDDDPWLSDDQQHAWRHWIALSTALPAALNRQLQEGSGLSLTDYDVLVALSEIPRGRLRVGDLASALGWERSRVSHHVRRMEGRGLV
ncbi:MAG: MarR family transcriptional regulator, partial [Herbiconiux sp.]|nr:MarR family transcriptional regulator [Herbiconiux sp.]